MEKAGGRTLPITAWGVEHDTGQWARYRDAGADDRDLHRAPRGGASR